MGSGDAAIVLVMGVVLVGGIFMFSQMQLAMAQTKTSNRRTEAEQEFYDQFITPDTEEVAKLNDKNLSCNVVLGCTWCGPAGGSVKCGPRVSYKPTSNARTRARQAFLNQYKSSFARARLGKRLKSYMAIHYN